MRNRIIAGVVTGLMALSLGTAMAGAASAAPTTGAKPMVLIPSGCNFSSTPPTIAEGSPDVGAVQQLQVCLNLSLDDDGLNVDGSFGPLTEAAVIEFQRCDRIGVDGIVGPQTWGALKRVANSPTFADTNDPRSCSPSS